MTQRTGEDQGAPKHGACEGSPRRWHEHGSDGQDGVEMTMQDFARPASEGVQHQARWE